MSYQLAETIQPHPNLISGLPVAAWLTHFLSDSAGCVTKLAEKYGYDSSVAFPTPMDLSTRKYVVGIGPERNRIILGNRDAFRTTGYMFNGPDGSAMSRIRSGLIHSRGKEHTDVRALLQPIFSNKSMDKPISQFIKITNEQMDRWTPGQPISMWHEMCLLGRRLSGRILLGNESDESLDRLSISIQQIIDLTFNKLIWACPFDLPGTPFRKMLKVAERIESLLLKMIQRRRNDIGDPENHDVLSRMIHARFSDDSSLTDEQLVGQIVFFFSASFETTATAMMWTLISLSQHPRIAHEVREEIDSVLGDSEPNLRNVAKLELLDRVIKESMRLFPPLPSLSRIAMESVDLFDMPIDKGDRIVVSPYATHRNPDVFSRPRQFDPARWETLKPSPWEYLPFGAGARYCVAANYAKVLLKVCLSTLLKRTAFELPKNTRIDRQTRIVLKSRNDVLMNVIAPGNKISPTFVRGNINDSMDINRCVRVG